jgi:DegV family protein with EDD domain
MLDKTVTMWYDRLVSTRPSGRKERFVSIRIVTDSNCDLPPEIVDQYGITVVPMYVNIGAASYLDGVDLSREQFYEGLPTFKAHPTTSVPSPGQFYEVYQRLAAEGASAILSIHISISLSAVVNSARLAAQEFAAVPVTLFDSGQLTLGTGLQALAAAKAAAEGRSLAEIVALLRDQSARTYTIAALDTLEFLRRSGRLSRFQWGLGSMLQVKPLLKMHGGEVDMERVRTRNGATGRLLDLVQGLGPLEALALVHTHAPERAELLRQKAQALFPAGQMPLSAEVTPVIGAHIGPGAAGFVAIQRKGEER